MESKEYKIIKDFVEWCDENDYTELIYFDRAFDNIFKKYLEYKETIK